MSATSWGRCCFSSIQCAASLRTFSASDKAAARVCAYVREQTLGFLLVRAAIGLLDAGKLIHVARGSGEHVGGAREAVVIESGGGQRVEERGLPVEVARDFVLGGGELLLRSCDCAALGRDLRANGARKIVQAGEPHQPHQAGQHRRRDFQS